MKKFKFPKLYKPYLDFVVDVGFAHIRTVLMRQSYERYTYDYISIQWKLFKWNGKFGLYRPGMDNF